MTERCRVVPKGTETVGYLSAGSQCKIAICLAAKTASRPGVVYQVDASVIVSFLSVGREQGLSDFRTGRCCGD
jgi:hypothetical protein